MDEKHKGKYDFGQRITAGWLSLVPRPIRLLLLFGGLLLLIYFANKGIWF